MHTHLFAILRSTLLVASSLSTATIKGQTEDIESQQLSQLRDFIPMKGADLDLVFRFETAGDETDLEACKRMHALIDRAGPTVVLLQARGPYDREPRVVGGYNPNKWKNWRGLYESAPGSQVFSLTDRQSWHSHERTTHYLKANPREYGLNFGQGDLVINPDLRSGTARNTSFGSDPQGSVLFGQSGPFAIESIRIYKLVRTHPQEEVPFLLPKVNLRGPNFEGPRRPVYAVPDSGYSLFHIFVGLAAVGTFRYFVAKRR